MTLPPGAPAPSHAPSPLPPQGPGVQPPFIAPPTDGARQRRNWSIGLGITAAVVLCVGGLGGLGAVVVLGERAVAEQSRVAVTDYLTALKEDRFEDAFDQLCEQQQAQGKASFVRQQERGAALIAFTVGEPTLTDVVEVPATLRFSNSAASRSVTFRLEQDTDTGQFEVCGVTD